MNAKSGPDSEYSRPSRNGQFLFFVLEYKQQLREKSRQMRKFPIILILVFSLLSFSALFADEEKDSLSFWPTNGKKLFLNEKIDLFLLYFPNAINNNGHQEPEGNGNSYLDDYSQRIRESITHFSLAYNQSSPFSLKIPQKLIRQQEISKNYIRPALEITSINMILWSFNRYIMNEDWANVSLDSILKNLRIGPAWDIDTYITNHLGHPFHGATHYSIARGNGMNFLESTLYSTFGSFTWEYFLESIRPSTNDLLLNTLGGITLGELLYRTAGLIIDESSVGIERAIREFLAFVVNPGNFHRLTSGKAFRIGYPPEERFYSLKLPVGAYGTSMENPWFIIAANLEYNDYLKSDLTLLNPYEWFSLDFRLGFQDYRAQDQEIFTTGILAGRKVRNGVAGLFGVFDYINSHIMDRMSAIGVGPGIFVVTDLDSDYYLNTTGLLTIILGGSSPSINGSNGHFGTKLDDPYYFGPGMLGRFKFELGKKGLGSIHTGYSQYWVHSIFDSANEFLGILTFKVNCEVTDWSQISLGYDYYLRYATLYDERYSGAKPAVRALYILKF